MAGFVGGADSFVWERYLSVEFCSAGRIELLKDEKISVENVRNYECERIEKKDI